MGTKPFVWKNEDGTYGGFEWEIFQELGKRIGVAKVDYEITEWSTLIPGLKADRWDIILSSMSATQERVQNAGIEFSTPYFLLIDHVIVKGDSPIQSVADLKGKVLGSTLGTNDSLNAHRMVDNGEAGSVLDFNTFGEPFVALENGQVDAVILDQGTLAGQREKLDDLRIVGDPIYYKPKPEWADAEAKSPYVFGAIAVGVRRECPDLLAAVNKGLGSMDADGTRKAILEKYGMWADYVAKLTK
ncbi:MAG TPA: transporter substrate-binding domain-containing protein [Mesorhizobium sp.]|nr:transporter substrate-binding domain-containing protein [Mesorhizobium sp.]